MRAAAVGHVEWVRFLKVDGTLHPGAIVHGTPVAHEPAGGGGVAVAELARLLGAATLITAVGSDALGQAVAPGLADHGVHVVASLRDEPHRQAITLMDPSGERTIVVVGPAQAPRGHEHVGALEGFDAVYLCKGDVAMVREARRARVLVATARMLPVLREAGVPLDALVRSEADPSERYEPGDLDPPPRLIATTQGAQGGRYQQGTRTGRWAAAPPLGALADPYGCGDRFAAGLTVALAHGLPVDRALARAAVSGAYAACVVGAHGTATLPSVG